MASAVCPNVREANVGLLHPSAVRAVLDVVAFLGIMAAMIAVLMFLDGGSSGSIFNPFSWIWTIGGAYLAHRFFKWIANTKPRWQVERESQERVERNSFPK